jgi:hypothetical protein
LTPSSPETGFAVTCWPDRSTGWGTYRKSDFSGRQREWSQRGVGVLAPAAVQTRCTLLISLGNCFAPGSAKDNLHITVFVIKRLTFRYFDKELEVG